MAELLFGTGGVPHSAADRSVLAGVRRIRELELDCMEVEFVRGVRIEKDIAEQAGQAAAELGVRLTCHGPYYINLNADEPDKKGTFDQAHPGHSQGGPVAGSEKYHLPRRVLHETGQGAGLRGDQESAG